MLAEHQPAVEPAPATGAGGIRVAEPLDQQARIARLVYELRNDFYPTRDFFLDAEVIPPVGPAPENERRAAVEILEIGLVAIPALAEVSDDRTLTRTVTFSPRFGGGLYVETVGRKATELISKISGDHGFSCYPPPEQEVLEWYEAERKRRRR
jgi:hypothetical protein